MAMGAGRPYARRKTSSLSNVMGSLRERNRLSTGQSQRCKVNCKAHDYGARCALKYGEALLHAFPSAERLHRADDNLLRAAGLSENKLATLRRVTEALLSGSLDEAMLEERPSPDAAEILCGIKAIGPWTATVILLRGLGRLDVFPMNDSSVARNLAFVAGAAAVDVDRFLNELGTQRGMLDYHLLLARLDAPGEIGRASFA